VRPVASPPIAAPAAAPPTAVCSAVVQPDTSPAIISADAAAIINFFIRASIGIHKDPSRQKMTGRSAAIKP
jgi:hypothetical protein